MKHAFLILVHNNFRVLNTLIRQLDYSNNDIYIHVDKKNKQFIADRDIVRVKNANLFFIDRHKVGWCEYSTVEAVVELMKEAKKTYHDYYHIMSGADLLISTYNEFNQFFEDNRGKEFVGFTPNFNLDLVNYRHYFQSNYRNPNRYVQRICFRLHSLLIKIQKVLFLKVKRSKEFLLVKKGADWYSVTHNAIEYLIEQESKFRRCFRRAWCPSEFFAQTILYNSEFKMQLYMNNSENEMEQSQRYIDWERGTPYVFRNSDKNILSESNCLIARKFDENIDMDIVNYIYSRYSLNDPPQMVHRSTDE